MSNRHFFLIGTFLLTVLLHSSFGQNHTYFSLGPSKEINPHIIGVNGNLAAFHHPWTNKELQSAFKRLQVSNLRYPAGTLGNYWDWELGALDRSVPDSLMIPWVVEKGLHKSEHRYPLEDLAAAHQKLDFIPVFMLNMLSKDLDHSVTHLLRAKALGLPVQYIELGNELYFGLPFESSRYPTPEAYGKTCSRWIDSLRHHFPNAKYAVIGTYLERNPRQKNWTKRVLAHCKNADAVTFHAYSPPGIDGKLERKSITAGNEGNADYRTATRPKTFKSVAARQVWERALLNDSAAYANFLQTAVKSAERYQRMGVPESMEIWATEFNMRADSSALRGTWANTLYTAKYYDVFLAGPVGITNIHNITGDLFPQIHTETHQLAHVLDTPLATVPYSLSAQGIATALFASASKGMYELSPLVFNTVPKIKDDREQTVSLLSGWLFSSEKKRIHLIVNYGNLPILLALPKASQYKRYVQYHAPLAHYISDGLATVENISGTPESSLLLPANSFTLIE